MSLLDTFGWRGGGVESISVVSIRMNKSSMTTISFDLGRWRPFKLSEACSTHVGHMRLRCYYDNPSNTTNWATTNSLWAAGLWSQFLEKQRKRVLASGRVWNGIFIIVVIE